MKSRKKVSYTACFFGRPLTPLKHYAYSVLPYNQIFCILWFAKPMVSNRGVFTKTTKTTNTIQTARNKRVECWTSGHHRNHGNDEYHAKPGCKQPKHSFRWHLHQKVRFLVVGRHFLSPGHPGVRLRNVCGKSRPKSLCLYCCLLAAQISSRFN